MLPATFARLRRPAASTSTTDLPSTSRDVPIAEALDDRVEQVARPEALRGRDGDRVAEAEAVEVGGRRDRRCVVDLVRGHDHGLLGRAQLPREVLVPRPVSY